MKLGRAPPPNSLPASSTRSARARPVSVGVEEELLLVDEQTLDLSPCRRRASSNASATALKHELFASFVETATTSADRAAAGARQVVAPARARRRASRAPTAWRARDRLAPVRHARGRRRSSTTPTTSSSSTRRGRAARRQGVCGLHVHVGMPDPETCVRARGRACPGCPSCSRCPRTRRGSAGRETAASTRAEVLATLPRSGGRRRSRRWRRGRRLMERWIRAGVLQSRRAPGGTRASSRARHARAARARPADRRRAARRRSSRCCIRLVVRAAEGEPSPRNVPTTRTNRFAASRSAAGDADLGDPGRPRSSRRARLDASCEAERQLREHLRRSAPTSLVPNMEPCRAAHEHSSRRSSGSTTARTTPAGTACDTPPARQVRCPVHDPHLILVWRTTPTCSPRPRARCGPASPSPSRQRRHAWAAAAPVHGFVAASRPMPTETIQVAESAASAACSGSARRSRGTRASRPRTRP